MKFFILDPNLKDANGHHREWDLSVALAAADAGYELRLYGHRNAGIQHDDRIVTVPYFSHTTYSRRSTDSISGVHDDCEYFNALLAGELGGLSKDLFAPHDIVFVPTLSEKHILGFIAWMKSFDPTTAPAFFIHLMLPSGISVDTSGGVAVVDSYRALLYRLAFRKAAEEGPEIRFFAGGTQVAAQYSVLAGYPIEPLSIPLRPVRDKTGVTSRRKTLLLYAGDAKPEKSFGLVPELVELLCREHADWDFVVHANAYGMHAAKFAETCQALSVAAERFTNFRLHTGWLSSEEYQAILGADCMLFTHRPDYYFSKSSGILWECISLGVPVVVPAGGWLERECSEWDNGFRTYSQCRVEAMHAALSAAGHELELLARKSGLAAQHYRSLSGGEATVRQLESALKSARPRSAAIAPVHLASMVQTTHHPISANANGDSASAEDAVLNDYHCGEKYRHLDVSLLQVALEKDAWTHLRFQLGLSPRGRFLRFRQGRGWPKTFGGCPSTGRDRQGPFIVLRDDPELDGAISLWRDVHDRRALKAVAALLPAAAIVAVRQERCSGKEAKTWTDAATAMSQRLISLVSSDSEDAAAALPVGGPVRSAPHER